MSRGRNLLASLLPPGRAFPLFIGSEFMKLLSAFGAELDRLELRARDLREEADPRTTSEMLPDWERVLEIAAAGSFTQRERTAAALLAMRGGQSAAYLVRVARAIGYNATVTEYPDFEPPPLLGQELTEEQKKFCFQVTVQDASTFSFTVGMKIGQPLRIYGVDSVDLKTMIAALKPAHTHAVLAFTE